MAKNKAAVIDEPVNTDIDFSGMDAESERSLQEIDPLEQIPCFIPNKAGFEDGQTLSGRFLGTKRVFSDKFTAGKRDEEGRMYRDLHTFMNTKVQKKFGIWSVGTLSMVLSRVLPGEMLRITYTGLADKPLKVGQSAPHTFKFEARPELQLNDVTANRNEDQEVEVLASNTVS